MLGFILGIGIIIGIMQIKDFFGLQMVYVLEYYLQKVGVLFMVLFIVNIGDVVIGVVMLGMLIFWLCFGICLSGYFFVLLVGCVVMGIVNLLGGNVVIIGLQFYYVLVDGIQGNGILQFLL